MKIASTILAGTVVCAALPAFAKPAYVPSTVNLRAAPGTGSQIISKIPGGSLVDAVGCDGGWCEVKWQDKTGYAIQTALDMSGRVPQQRAPAESHAYRQAPPAMNGPQIVEGPVYYDPPPPVVYYGGPYYRPYWGWRRRWW